MDYDRYDAFLHHIFERTQGDAWFRPFEDNLSSGVALRIENGRFRVFPYENLELEPFETAVAALNPVVAVKVRSAAVHAALADLGPEQRSIYVDVNTRIQVLDTMLLLPHADKEQCAAFIRDERVMVVWSDALDAIIPTCKDFEDRLIKLLWRSRPPPPPSFSTATGQRVPSYAGSFLSASAHGSEGDAAPERARARARDSRGSGRPAPGNQGSGLGSNATAAPSPAGAHERDVEKGHGALGGEDDESELGYEDLPGQDANGASRGGWSCFGRRAREGDAAKRRRERERDRRRVTERGVRIVAPVYNGIAAGLALYFMCAGVNILIREWSLDGNFMHFVLAVLIPFLFSISLFFALQIVQNCSFAVGPIAQYHENSKYYSAIAPLPNKAVDNNLPHVTIQMPVYKESLEKVLAPAIASIKRAMQTYARQGGTSAIFVCDDGLQLLSAPDRDARLAYYADHGIGWVARPKHEDTPGGFKRAGRFKKASNMNYGLRLSLALERHLAALQEKEKEKAGEAASSTCAGGSNAFRHSAAPSTAMSAGTSAGTEDEGEQTQTETQTQIQSLEDRALALAVEEEFAATGERHRPWAGNGKAIRMGELVLLVDADTAVPVDCFRDAARELAACPTVAVLQHESAVLRVAGHYFENGVAYFTRRVNKSISMACANGEVAPFVGHNAFLRWRAIQDAAFLDADGVEKIWSESNVSEDFDMALRLMLRGYIIRWARYSHGEFKEGVSLTVDDELNRWQKYAYGCSELLFNPFVQWLRKGPINHQIHRFIWSNAPLHYKLSMMAYMFSYFGIAATMTISLINYVLLGFQFPVDGYYMKSFEIWLATTVVFFGSGTVGFTLLEYRLGEKDLIKALIENVKWVPFFFFFFGGLSIHLSQAILAHLFSYNIQWSATKKEVERSNFFKEVPKIFRRFGFAFGISLAVIAALGVLSTSLVPLEWRVDGSAWAVIFPLAFSAGCHILFPIVLNPWLMIFSY